MNQLWNRAAALIAAWKTQIQTRWPWIQDGHLVGGIAALGMVLFAAAYLWAAPGSGSLTPFAQGGGAPRFKSGRPQVAALTGRTPRGGSHGQMGHRIEKAGAGQHGQGGGKAGAGFQGFGQKIGAADIEKKSPKPGQQKGQHPGGQV